MLLGNGEEEEGGKGRQNLLEDRKGEGRGGGGEEEKEDMRLWRAKRMKEIEDEERKFREKRKVEEEEMRL